MRESNKNARVYRNIVKVLVVFGFIYVFAALFFPTGGPGVSKKAFPFVKSRSDMVMIGEAIKAYELAYQTDLTSDAVEIFRKLRGENPDKKPFLHWETNVNSRGEMLDAWGTEYALTLQDRTNIVIRSAGPDKKFGDTDDIVFNSVSNNFVKP
jgi:hypothetical protein